MKVWKDYKALMKSCWEQDPKDRPTFQEVHTQLTEMLANTKLRGRSLSAPEP